MNEELKETLREVLQAELKPVNRQLNQMDQRLEKVETGQQRLEQRFEKMNKRLEGVETGQQKIDQRLGKVETGQKDIQADLKVLIDGQKEIHNEITDYFNEMNTVMQTYRGDIEYTFHKTAQHELELRRLKNP
ncbi:MAG TPA: hypothetical protein VFT51_14935 [Bacillales bacterium]|nr:hypothetical protein [Bacillales bacterium]